MGKLINKFCENLANHSKFNCGVMIVAIAVQGVTTLAVMAASYFLGMRKGVDITDAYYDKEIIG